MAFDSARMSGAGRPVLTDPGDLSAEACFRLAIAYATGVGAEFDIVEAHKWFNIAAARGEGEARSRRQELTELMSASQIAAAQRAARQWLSRSGC